MISPIRTLFIASDRKPKLNPIAQKGKLLGHVTKNSWINLASLTQGLKQCHRTWSFSWFWLKPYPFWLSELYDLRFQSTGKWALTRLSHPCKISSISWTLTGHTPIPKPVSVAKRMKDSAWSGPLICQQLVKEEVNLIQNFELSLKKNVILQENKGVCTLEEHWRDTE